MDNAHTPIWNIGYRCAIAYGGLATNPHPPGSDDWREWDAGHAAGMDKLRECHGGELPPLEDYAPTIHATLAEHEAAHA